jgi:alpha-L-rhamnosidase
MDSHTKYLILLALLVILFTRLTPAIIKADDSPSGLKVNQIIEPLSVDIRKPYFSWIDNSNDKGDYQTAYRIIVSSTKDKAETNKADIWDSGKIISFEQSDIVYEGIPLNSEMNYYWKVCIWNKNDNQSKWSDISRFATGMLKISDWNGKYIGKRDYQLYRKEFVSDSTKNIENALLYIGSWGVPVVYINGRKVSDVVLNTADCVYRKTTWYRGFDVSDMIKRGRNAIGVMMGNGLLGRADGDASDIRFILNLVIRYRDSLSVVISSDGTWKATTEGPLVIGEQNNVMDGEKYDARKAQEENGWTKPFFNDSNWETGSKVLNISEPENTLKSQLTPPMKVIETFPPKSIKEIFPGIYTVDAGRNLTGWLQINVNGNPGDKIDLRYAESLSSLWKNYDYSFTVNIISHCAGILFRTADENNYYYWKFTTGKLSAYKRVNGNLIVLKESPYDFKLNTDYNIKIKTNGNKFKTYCNSELINSISDNTFNSGKVGFYESPEDTAIFSNIEVANHDSALLISDGSNPDLWLNNHNVRIDHNHLEVTDSKFLVSRFGNINGGIDQSSLSVPSFVPNAGGSGAKEHDYYIHGFNAVETWEPFQTLHGFRYVQVTGFKGTLTKNIIKVRDVSEAIDSGKNDTGSFTSSNRLINNLYNASISSIKSAFQWGIPASCVSRDERSGWTGDGESTSQAANYYADMGSCYKQWFIDMRETQHSDGYIDNLAPRQGERAGAIEEDIPWSSAVINVTWDTYLASGDKSIISEQYKSMKRFIGWCINTSNISKSSGNFEDYTSDKDCWGDYGSLLEMKTCCPIPMPQKSLYATAFFYNSVRRLSILADAIGKTAESGELKELASKIRNAYNKKFLKEDVSGAYYLDNTQTDNALSLTFGLCPENKKSEVVKHLVRELKDNNYSLTVGVLGLYTIFDALCDNGYTDFAYKIVNKTTYPSWGWWIKHGATTMWEFWNCRGSHNHMFMGGKMNAFLIKNLAGISPLKPGYDQVLIKPGVVGDLKNISANIYSPKGQIKADWIKSNDNEFILKTIIPVNSSADIYIPLLNNKPSDAVVFEKHTEIYKDGVPKDNKFIKFVNEKDGCLVFKVDSGSYEFNLNKK